MNPAPDTSEHGLATHIRAACIRAALEGYERAQMDGLCHEGAWECAIEAIRALDLQELIVQYAGRVTVTGDI